MKKLLICIFLMVYGTIFSQNYKITYLKSSNGSLIENQDPIVVFASSTDTHLTTESILNKKAAFPYEETVVKRASNVFIQMANLNESKSISTKDSISLSKQTFEILPEIKTIKGYQCKKAKIIVNSNTIDLWYTDELKVK